MSSTRSARESELVNKISIAIQGERPTLLGLIGEMEAYLLANAASLKNEPKRFKKLKKLYRKAVNKYADIQECISMHLVKELTDLTQVPADKSKAPLSHQRCFNFTDQLALEAAKDLLSKETKDERTIAMERWIAIMRRQFNRRDYQTANAILSALNFDSISRLNSTKEGLTPEAKQLKAEIESLMAKQAVLIENKNKVIIPRFVYYTGHFTKLLDRISVDKKRFEETGDSYERSQLRQQIAENEYALQRYVKELQVIQRELEQKLEKDQTKLNYFLYEKMTAAIDLEETRKGERLYEKSLQHEPRGTKVVPANQLSQTPELSLNQNKRVIINKRCRQIIKIDAAKKAIENHNSEIKGALRQLHDYSAAQADTRSGNDKRKRIEQIRKELEPLEKYVQNPIGKGSIPEIKQYIAIIENALRDDNNHKHTHFNFIKKQKGVDTTLVVQLKTLKTLLEKAEKLESERAALQQALDGANRRRKKGAQQTKAVDKKIEKTIEEKTPERVEPVKLEDAEKGKATEALPPSLMSEDKPIIKAENASQEKNVELSTRKIVEELARTVVVPSASAPLVPAPEKNKHPVMRRQISKKIERLSLIFENPDSDSSAGLAGDGLVRNNSTSGDFVKLADVSSLITLYEKSQKKKSIDSRKLEEGIEEPQNTVKQKR